MFCDVVLNLTSQFRFDKQTALRATLPVAIKHREEVLVVSLAHVWSKNEVVLIPFVYVVDAEPFTSGVGKPRNDVSRDGLEPLTIGCF